MGEPRMPYSGGEPPIKPPSEQGGPESEEQNEDPQTHTDETGNIIDFEEAKKRLAQKSENKELNFETKKTSLEGRVLEVFHLLETRARSLSKRVNSAYDRIGGADIELERKQFNDNFNGFYGDFNYGRTGAMDDIGQAQSIEDLDETEQNLEKVFVGVSAELDKVETRAEEYERETERPSFSKESDLEFEKKMLENRVNIDFSFMAERLSSIIDKFKNYYKPFAERLGVKYTKILDDFDKQQKNLDNARQEIILMVFKLSSKEEIVEFLRVFESFKLSTNASISSLESRFTNRFERL